MALSNSTKSALATFVGAPLLLVGICWVGVQYDNYKEAEAAKPKPMAPCESVLDDCYVNNGHGDAAWLIKRQDEMYGTTRHEERLNEARGELLGAALCEHKAKQGLPCN